MVPKTSKLLNMLSKQICFLCFFFFSFQIIKASEAQILGDLEKSGVLQREIQKSHRQDLQEQAVFWSSDSELEPFLSPEVMGETLKIAKKIYSLVKGKKVISLGQTPSYLMSAVEDLVSLDKNDSVTQIYFVPFSGRPDYAMPLRCRVRGLKERYKDYVTEDKELIFRKVLVELGLKPENLSEQDLFIVDNSTGPSVISFATLLLRFCRDKGVEPPQIKILLMRKREEACFFDGKKYVPAHKKEQAFNQVFSPQLQYNFPVVYLGMEESTIVAYDKIGSQLRLLPSFPAFFWNESYKFLFKVYPTAQAKFLRQKHKEFVLEEQGFEI